MTKMNWDRVAQEKRMWGWLRNGDGLHDEPRKPSAKTNRAQPSHWLERNVFPQQQELFERYEIRRTSAIIAATLLFGQVVPNKHPIDMHNLGPFGTEQIKWSQGHLERMWPASRRSNLLSEEWFDIVTIVSSWNIELVRILCDKCDTDLELRRVAYEVNDILRAEGSFLYVRPSHVEISELQEKLTEQSELSGSIGLLVATILVLKRHPQTVQGRSLFLETWSENNEVAFSSRHSRMKVEAQLSAWPATAATLALRDVLEGNINGDVLEQMIDEVNDWVRRFQEAEKRSITRATTRPPGSRRCACEI